MNKLTVCTALLLTAAVLGSCGKKDRDPEEYVIAENFTVYESTAPQETATIALTETLTAPTEEVRLSYALNGTSVELSINDRKIKTLDYYYTPDEKHIIVADFNFDGFKDIYIPYENAESGCGYYYCYDEKSNDFYEDKPLNEVGMEMETTGIRFTYTGNVPDDVLVIADVEQMKRVVNNIISNSVKYNDKENGEISLTLLDDGDFVRVEIRDNGQGISKEDLPNIFNRFYRADASRTSRKGGSGIGLSIVKKIIEDHGGRVWARSEAGKGTTIIFSLRKYLEKEI